MAKFSQAAVADVVPVPKSKQPSKRAEMQSLYQQQLREALDNGEALVIELEPSDKPLTERQRLYAAAAAIGRTIKVKRRGEKIAAFEVSETELVSEEEQAHAEAEAEENSEIEAEEAEVEEPEPTITKGGRRSGKRNAA